jgi:hypothetical protein
MGFCPYQRLLNGSARVRVGGASTVVEPVGRDGSDRRLGVHRRPTVRDWPSVVSSNLSRDCDRTDGGRHEERCEQPSHQSHLRSPRLGRCKGFVRSLGTLPCASVPE